jgi:hypothetical protein
VAAGLVIEFAFDALGLAPTGPRHAKIVEASVTWNYTTFLNVGFLLLTAVLLVRFIRTGGAQMLRMMDAAPPGPHDQEDHDGPHGHDGHGDHSGHSG